MGGGREVKRWGPARRADCGEGFVRDGGHCHARRRVFFATGFKADETATVVARLQAAGAIIFGTACFRSPIRSIMWVLWRVQCWTWL